MSKSREMVSEFHEAFGISVASEPPPFPLGADDALGTVDRRAFEMVALGEALHTDAKELGGNMWLLRLQLLQEELGELATAIGANDHIEQLDALLDLQYVLDGAILSLGFDAVFDEAFEEVHRSNMSKLDGDGKPVKDTAGRVIKSALFSQPELGRFIHGTTLTDERRDELVNLMEQNYSGIMVVENMPFVRDIARDMGVSSSAILEAIDDIEEIEVIIGLGFGECVVPMDNRRWRLEWVGG